MSKNPSPQAGLRVAALLLLGSLTQPGCAGNGEAEPGDTFDISAIESTEQAVVQVNATFTTGADGFVYADDTFGTGAPAGASGTHGNGQLHVKLGSTPNSGANSGGWRRTFNGPGVTTIAFDYALRQPTAFEADECTEVRVSVDSTTFGGPGQNYVVRTCDGGTRSGRFTLTTGNLATGTHTLTIGAYMNRNSAADEILEVDFGNVLVDVAAPVCGDATCNATETCTSCPADCGVCPDGRNIANRLEAEANDGMFGVQFETTTDTGGGQNAGYIASGDYIQWLIDVPSSGEYTVTTRSATWVAASLQLQLDGSTKATLSLPKTWSGAGSQYQTWGSFTSSAFSLSAGLHTLRVAFTSGNQNLNWIKVNPPPVCGNGTKETGEDCDDANLVTEACAYGQTSCTVCDSSCHSVPGAVSRCGDSVIQSTNEDCDDGNTITEACAVGVPSCTVCGASCRLVPGLVTACGDGICSSNEYCSSCPADCGACPGGRNLGNNLEAEANDGMFGIQYEPTTDAGGGKNAGYIAADDYVQWSISVPLTGNYTLTSRSATWAAASFRILVDGTQRTTLNLPKT